MQTGVIPVVRIGKAVRIREEDIDNFVLNSKVQANPSQDLVQEDKANFQEDYRCQ